MPRDRIIQVRVTADQEAAIKALAAGSHMGVSEWVRASLLLIGAAASNPGPMAAILADSAEVRPVRRVVRSAGAARGPRARAEREAGAGA